MSNKVSIIMPCYNEVASISEALARVAVLRDGLDIEIIVVDDGSTDDSFEKLSNLAGPGITLLRHEVNRGKGAAIVTGAKHAAGDVIVIQDADLEYDASLIPALVEPIQNDRSDIVYGSRFKGKIEGMSISHIAGNKILSYFTSALCGREVTDMMTGQKAFRAAAFRSLNLESERFEFELEVTFQAIRHGYTFMEIPIPYERRRLGTAKIGWSDGLRTMAKIIRFRLSYR